MTIQQTLAKKLATGLTGGAVRQGMIEGGEKILRQATVDTRDQLLRSATKVARKDTIGQAVIDAVLKEHGIKLPADMKATEVEGLRRYLTAVDNRYDKGDVADALHDAFRAGKRDLVSLTVEAERVLYAQRGVSAKDFARLEKLGFSGEQMDQLRRFADAHAASQGGKYLTVAAKGATTAELADAQRLVARTIARDFGLIAPKGVDERVLLSIVRDIGTEDPRNAKSMVKAANDAFKAGTTDYYAIHALTTRGHLGELGVDAALLGRMDVSDAALKAAAPGLETPVARAEQLRLLRDRLRVLPEGQRQEAVAMLSRSKATLVDFDQALSPFFEQKLAALTGGDAALASEILKGLPVQQRANILSDFANLPAETRQQVFSGLVGTPAEKQAQAVDRLVALSEQRYGVKVHRAAGQSPFQGADPAVLDWSLQGATELLLGLDAITGGKKLSTVTGTTYFHLANLEGKLSPQAAAEERSLMTMYRPGAGRYRADQSGLMGKEYRGMGYRTERGGQEFVALYDTALKLDNANRAVGVSRGIGTVVHETGHVHQLGGPGEQQAVSDWSKLSNWREPDRTIADGTYTVHGQREDYYKDPAVQLGDRQSVVSQYGATDTVEDWAEFTRVFALDPSAAMGVSSVKFLEMNESYQQRYAADKLPGLAKLAGLSEDALQKSIATLKRLLKRS